MTISTLFRIFKQKPKPKQYGEDVPLWLQKHDKTDWITLQRRLRNRAKELKASEKPILVGPWISEVGYEVLYWVPFLEWFVNEHQIPKERLYFLSRGGARPWYERLGAHYLDVFDLMTPAEFRAENEKRWAEKDTQKQKKEAELDKLLVELATKKLGFTQYEWLHPGLMYNSLRYFWKGTIGTQWLESFTRFQPYPTEKLAAIRAELGLPKSYSAVKIYFNASFPKTEANERFCVKMIEKLAKRGPVVLLDTGLQIDDHEELAAKAASGNIITLADKMTPTRNLEQQTAVVHGAESFYGTYGGFSYLGPFLGVPSFSFYSNPDQFIPGHLHAAAVAARNLRAQGLERSDFVSMNLNTFERTFDV